MNKKGFTLLELITVIVIVGILAAAGVPLYLNYVKDAKRAVAKATIDAIYTAERVYKQKTNQFAALADIAAIESTLDIDLDPAVEANWGFAVTTAGVAPSDTVTITATGSATGNATGLSVAYDSSTGTWTES
ncbi:MAG TPA: prepilin-type N-terminal cleavage/methylation domain-containing protein [Candidatus Mcinerneyibacteriales bacterium]|nr:prepilin-type N-terminal cleavage/methylation domain-containing protein [Candidatus Mcinerneyibacteriales bacterium]HPE20565.1 prepilin-type N-terminal cleavage/methylation domain-containing protein [Candidatus Mcinerneyibacteriales bacterium]HPJ70059.1 prepilin-type N-terminal cleavage/methylation domain-containing protein [Candidatus Mcinerneyibacteriales bacterium]HPQ89628.1 prepilin-type N-terminal cleavage/methylation domain-containing protein [Candidatus Mcinerneyibacteriales bacterium]